MTRKIKQTKKLLLLKKQFISKTAKIKCNSIKLGNNISIGNGVELTGDKIIIRDGVVIDSQTKISSKLIQIGKNSRISNDCNIFTIESFTLGNRSDLCTCKIKGRNVNIGDDFYSSNAIGGVLTIGGGNSFFPNSNLTIGNRCTIHDVYINIAMPVTIGNDVGVSPGTTFYTHYFWNSIFEGYPQKFADINIGNGCIIGAESFFLPGVKIGKDCVIGARTVVTKNFPASCVIAGNPAKIIKQNYRKKLSSREVKDLLKHLLLQYTEILKTKGFTVKKIDKNCLRYKVTKKNYSSIILYDSNNKNIPRNKNVIILSFKDLPITKTSTLINLTERTLTGVENELTDDLRDFLRKAGIRIFTDRRFKQISYTSYF